jgi:hypothetical protein
MAGSPNLFPRFAFEVGADGKLDTGTRAFLSKFTGRIGPRIPDLPQNATWSDVAIAANALIREFEAQGWVKRGFDAEEHSFRHSVRAVTMIPAATEFGYAPYEVFSDVDPSVGIVRSENGYAAYGDGSALLLDEMRKAGRIGSPPCDWQQSLDNLQTQVPNAKLINLFVTWFGDDLRAGSCSLYPAVTTRDTASVPNDWRVAGIARANARVISKVNGSAAYGGTPDDQSVIDAIRDLKARKLEVAFTPFLLMDVPANNGRQDPYTGAANQPVYPWRGRITKAFGTADKSAQAAAEVSAFVTEYRRFVLHYANLCASAGGVDIFVLGTELRGLTWLRDAAGFPFVTALRTLAADVKAILPAAALTYASDWTEWFGFHPQDGSGDVAFHLDPLWADPNIAAVSIDVYWPRSDWRDGNGHLDWREGRAITDADYLTANIRGGEGYDWYYASDADRQAQIRTPMTDGAYGKPWVFRFKDIWNWWANRHYERPGGIEAAQPTAWQPQMKPIWFTELGIPSVDKGTNQPNVFVDPKSSESALPYFSSGKADIRIQQRGLAAMLSFFNPAAAGFDEANNPVSPVYGGRMVDPARVMLYTWDARPYPAFPQYTAVWNDAANWPFGHWLGGKLSTYASTYQEPDTMPIQTTFAPRHPYIVDAETGQIDKQWRDFFFGIEFVQGEAIPAVPLDPTPAEAARAINQVLAVLRAQKRIV